MTWKQKLNSALASSIGLQLVRTGSLPPPATPAPRPAAPRRRQGRALPADYEAEFLEIWDRVKSRTMTSHEKGYYLHQAVRYVTAHGIPGAVVECGVWRGGSMLNVAHTLVALGSTDRDLFLFDTFSGMSEPTARDVHLGKRTAAAEMLETATRDERVWAIASIEDVREGFASVDYPDERVHFVEGKVEDTIPGHAPGQIAILRLDTDWYESTKHELTHLYDRLAPGGVLIIDDYGTWQGSRDAMDEFLSATGEPLLLVRTGWGRGAVKPGLPRRAG
jgi:hypothetical protein